MRVALVLGNRGTDIKDKLSATRDNLFVDNFKSFNAFLTAGHHSGRSYDRVVTVSNILENEEDLLDDLYDFWVDSNQRLEFVVLSKKGGDTSFVESFVTKYSSPIVVAMLVESTTIHTIIDAVSTDVRDLNSKYGIQVDRSTEVLVDMMVVPDEVDDNVESDPKPDVSDNSKKGLFGRLFSKGTSTPQGTVSDAVELTNIRDGLQNSENSEDIVDSDSIPQSDATDDGSLEELIIPIDVVENDNLDESLSNSISSVDSVDEYLNKFSEIDDNDTSSLHCDDAEESFGAVNEETSSIASDTEDMLFESEEVDIDVNDLSVLDEEGEYRVNSEQPSIVEKVIEVEKVVEVEKIVEVEKPVEVEKVIERVIEVEKPVETAGSQETITTRHLNRVRSGKDNRVIIVTGDRGSGVTSLATDIAFELSESTSVLYFDADIENHGLLNYIEYGEFSKYSDTSHRGVLSCKSAKSFDNCVINYDDNVDILTTNFDVEVDDESLDVCQSVVSEISTRYGAVVVDVPLSKLHIMTDLIPISSVVFTVEASNRGIMNYICQIEKSPLSTRYKRACASRGVIVFTKTEDKEDMKSAKAYAKSIVDFDGGIDWLGVKSLVLDHKVDDDFLDFIISR